MISLIVTIIAVALVALLALATIYFAGPAMSGSSSSSKATEVVAQSVQVLGAAELYLVDQHKWSTDTAELVDKAYLKEVPRFQDVVWTQPMAGHPTYWVKASTDTEACKLVNLKARGDNGIYKKARPGLVTQCFGLSAPYTTITTRVGDGESGLKVVFEFLGDELWEYDEAGGGWSIAPTIGGEGNGNGNGEGNGNGGGGSAPPDGNGGGGGGGSSSVESPLPESLTLTSSGGEEIGELGAFPAGQGSYQEISITNTGSGGMTISPMSADGDFEIRWTTCPAVLAAGASCIVQVIPKTTAGAGSAEDVAITGTLRIGTGSGSHTSLPLRARVRGSSYPYKLPVSIVPLSGSRLDSTGALMFPDTPIGKSSSKWLQVTNVGPLMTYNGAGYNITTPFHVTASDCGGTLAVGAACRVRLTFTPTAVQSYLGTNHYYEVLANNSSARLYLTGRGLPAVPAVAANLTLQSSTLEGFSIPAHSIGRTIAVTFSNPGTTAVALQGQPVLVLDGAPVTAISYSCGTSVAAGSSCTVTIPVSPSRVGPITGSVTLNPNSTFPLTLPIDGVSTPPLLPITASGFNPAPGSVYVSPDIRNSWQVEGNYAGVAELKVELLPSSNYAAGAVTLDPVSGKLSISADAALNAEVLRIPIRATYRDKYSSDNEFVFYTQPVALEAMTSPYFGSQSLSACRITTGNVVNCMGSVNYGGQPGRSTNINDWLDVGPITGGSSALYMTGTSGTYCFLTTAGLVNCWGRNLPLADLISLTSNTTSVTRIPGLPSISQIKAGSSMSCGVATADQTVWCWGVSTPSGLKVWQATSFPVKSFTAGDGLCVVTLENAVQCMSPNPSLVGLNISKWAWTSPVGLGANVRQVIGDHQAFCALKYDNSLYCWGKLPVPVGGNAYGSVVSNAVLVASDVRKVYVYQESSTTDALLCILRTSGQFWCGGLNRYQRIVAGAADPVPLTNMATSFGLGSYQVSDMNATFSSMCLRVSTSLLHCRGSINSATTGGRTTSAVGTSGAVSLSAAGWR